MGGARPISRLREIGPGDTHHLARGPMWDGYRARKRVRSTHPTPPSNVVPRTRARHNVDKLGYDKRSRAPDGCQYLCTKESMYVPKEVLEYFIKYKIENFASQI